MLYLSHKRIVIEELHMRIVSKKHFGALRVAIIASAFALAFQPLTGGVSFALEGVVGEETAQNMQTNISENE